MSEKNENKNVEKKCVEEKGKERRTKKTKKKEGIEKDKIPRISFPKDQKYEYSNVSKVAEYISTTKNEIINTDEAIDIITTTSKQASVTIALKSDVQLSKSITQFDATVMDAIYSLYINECKVFSTEMVVRAITGNAKGRVSPQQIEAVTRSISKLRHVDITIDCTDEFVRAGGVVEDGEKLTKTSYLLPLNEYHAVLPANGRVVKTKKMKSKLETDQEIDIVAGYEFIQCPALYSYAEDAGAIEKFPVALLTSSDIIDTDENATLKWYLIRRIGALKKAKNKSLCKDIIYYDSEWKQGAFSDLKYEQCEYSNWRAKKSKIHATIVKILDGYKKEEYIKDYNILKDDKTKAVLGVEIIIKSDN